MQPPGERHRRVVDQRTVGRPDAGSGDPARGRRTGRRRPGGRRIVHPVGRRRSFPAGRADAAHRPEIAPEERHPLQGGARRIETHRRKGQRRRRVRILDAETAFLLQPLLVAAERRPEILRAGRRNGLVGLRRRRLRGAAAQDQGTSETRSDLDPFGGRRGPQIPGRKHPDPQRRKLQADPRLRPRPEAERRDGGPPQGRIHRTGPHRADRAAGRGRHLLRAAQTQPGFQEPDPLRPEIPDLGRPKPPLHLPRNATHGELRGRNQPRGAEQGGAPTRRKLHLHRGAALAGPCDPLHGQRLHPALVQPHEPAVRIGELRPGAGARAEDLRQQPAAILPAELLRRHLFLRHGVRLPHRPRHDHRPRRQGLDAAQPHQQLLARPQPPDHRQPEVDVPARNQGRRPADSGREQRLRLLFRRLPDLRRAVEGRHPVRHRHHLQEQRRRGADRLHHRPGLGAPERQLQGPGLRPPEPAAGRSRHRLRGTRRAEMRGRTLHGAGRG